MIMILNLLKKYMTSSEQRDPFWAEHDMIGICVDVKKISKEDLEILDQNNAYYDNNFDGVYIYV